MGHKRGNRPPRGQHQTARGPQPAATAPASPQDAPDKTSTPPSALLFAQLRNAKNRCAGALSGLPPGNVRAALCAAVDVVVTQALLIADALLTLALETRWFVALRRVVPLPAGISHVLRLICGAALQWLCTAFGVPVATVAVVTPLTPARSVDRLDSCLGRDGVPLICFQNKRSALDIGVRMLKVDGPRSGSPCLFSGLGVLSGSGGSSSPPAPLIALFTLPGGQYDNEYTLAAQIAADMSVWGPCNFSGPVKDEIMNALDSLASMNRSRLADIVLHTVKQPVTSITDPDVTVVMGDRKSASLSRHFVADATVHAVNIVRGPTILFWCGDGDAPGAAASNAAVLAFLRQLLNGAVPSDRRCAAQRIAAAVTDVGRLLDAGDGFARCEYVPETRHFSLHPSASSPNAAAIPGATPHETTSRKTVRRDGSPRACRHHLRLESVWPPEGDAEAAVMEAWGDVADAEAYVLEFAMDGVAGDAAALAAVEAQLEWGTGVRLEKRHGSAHERVTVHVTGPNRQVVHAETDLEEENVGEEGAMLRVRVAGGTGAVRLQFPPGQTNPDLVLR